jgi:hypothetical protein
VLKPKANASDRERAPFARLADHRLEAFSGTAKSGVCAPPCAHQPARGWLSRGRRRSAPTYEGVALGSGHTYHDGFHDRRGYRFFSGPFHDEVRACAAARRGSPRRNPWKDESGKGKRGRYGGYGRFGGYGYGGGWDGHPDRKTKVRTADGCGVSASGRGESTKRK